MPNSSEVILVSFNDFKIFEAVFGSLFLCDIKAINPFEYKERLNQYF